MVYGEIADNYTLVQFVNSSLDTASNPKDYEPHNLLKDLYQDDLKKHQDERKTVNNDYQARPSREGNAVARRKTALNGYWGYTFSHPLSSDNRKALKALLEPKKKIYSDLQAHYDDMVKKAKNQKKKIRLLPLSIYLEGETFSHDELGHSAFDRLKNHAELMNKQLPQVINKLSHRAAYGLFLGYSKLTMLTDENFKPFIHIIFYLSEGDISTWYAHDIGKTWHEVSGANVEIHYYSFTGKLPEPPQYDACQSKSLQDKNPGYRIVYQDARLPFPSEDSKRQHEIATYSAEQLRDLVQKLEMKKNDNENINPKQLKYVKQLLKITEGMKDTRQYHLDYLALVAKNYTKIPGLHALTKSDFSYRNQYSNAAYTARKARKEKTGKEILKGPDSDFTLFNSDDVIDVLPDNISEHIWDINK